MSSRLRLGVSALAPSREGQLLSPTVIPCDGGLLVVQVFPLSVRFSIHPDRNSPPTASVEMAIPQYGLLVEDADTAIIAARLGVLASPVGVQ